MVFIHRIVFFLFGVFIFTYGIAQQTVQYSQYLFNNYALNPAVAGSKECLDIRIGNRRQWVGFKGAPITYFVSLNYSFGKIRGGYMGGWHGVGVYVENDKTGPYTVKGFYPSYAYHKPFYKDYVAALGFFTGIRYHTFFGSYTGIDPALQVQKVLVYPDITPGIWVYSKNTYMGLSVKQLYKRKLKGQGEMLGTPSKIKPHYYFTFGKRIESKAYYYTYLPSVHLKYTPLSPPSIDINGMMMIKNKFGFGLSYRVMDAFVGLIKIKLYKDITLGYSFDFTTSRIRYGSSNTHEIIFGFNPCPFDDATPKQLCPAYD